MSAYYYHVSPEANLTALRVGTCVSRSLPSVARIDELMDDAASALRWGQPVFLYRVFTTSVEDRTEWITDGDTTMVAGGLAILTARVPVAPAVVIA